MSTDRALHSAFEGKKVFITGHTGFKGSWLALWLEQLGAEITGFSLPGESVLFDQLNLGKKLRDLRGDIRTLPLLKKSVVDAQPDFVFHLAAQPLVRASYRDPLETYSVNVMGTVHLLESCRSLERPCATVFVTTDKCYQNHEWLQAYRESDPLGGRDPYSASKAAAEIVVASYRDSFFPAGSPVRVASARAGNVIGGGDWAEDRLVPDCMRALKKKTSIVVRNPASTRPWQHVLEPLSGYLALAAALARETENAALASAFNFGPGIDSNRSVAALVAEILGRWPGESRDVSDPTAFHEAGRLNLATAKAFHLLGWQPAWDFKETVARTVDWYRYQGDGADVGELCRQQIKDHERSSTLAAEGSGL